MGVKMTSDKKLTVVIRILVILIIAVVILIAINIGYNEYTRRTHPIEFSETVERYAREFGVDKFLIYAVIKTESSFNPQAESHLGARGLMQIMPDTFDWLMNYRLFERNLELTFDDMYVIDHNVRYGAYFIAFNMEKYSGSIDNSLAAYHAGIGAVDGWLSNPDFSSDGVTLDKIPFADTQHYVNKVNAAYQTYLRLYT
jgi:soluble lytic murein transglycosylase